MKEIIKGEGKMYYSCKQCGFIYKDRETAERCEAWCTEHGSCNLDITIHAVQEEMEATTELKKGGAP